MAVLTSLPKFATSFEKLKIGLDLEKASGKGNTIIHMAIQHSFIKKRPLDEVIEWVKSQAIDNPDLMAETIGEELTCRIIKYNEA